MLLIDYKNPEFITLNYCHETSSVCLVPGCAAYYDNSFLLVYLPCSFFVQNILTQKMIFKGEMGDLKSGTQS